MTELNTPKPSNDTSVNINQTDPNLNLNVNNNRNIYIASPIPVVYLPTQAGVNQQMVVPIAVTPPQIIVPAQNTPVPQQIIQIQKHKDKKNQKFCYCRGPRQSPCGCLDPNEDYCCCLVCMAYVLMSLEYILMCLWIIVLCRWCSHW